MVSAVGHGGGYPRVGAEGIWEISVPFTFALNLKLLLKVNSLRKKNHTNQTNKQKHLHSLHMYRQNQREDKMEEMI